MSSASSAHSPFLKQCLNQSSTVFLLRGFHRSILAWIFHQGLFLFILLACASMTFSSRASTTDSIYLSQEVKYLPSDSTFFDYFGFSVSIEDDLAVVGASHKDGVVKEVGAAYVYQYNGISWDEVAKLIPSDGNKVDWRFGFSSAICSITETVIIGANTADAGTTQTNFGAAYIYQRNHGGADNWGEVVKLTAMDGDAFDYYGQSVAISSDTVLVGAYLNDGVAHQSGKVYVYDYDGEHWNLTAELVPPDAGVDHQFGFYAALDGDTAAILSVDDTYIYHQH